MLENTSLVERALGVLGIVWAINSIGTVDNYAYLFCTIPLLFLGVLQIPAAGRAQLEMRLMLTGLCVLVWCSIMLDVLARASLSLDTLRGVAFYGWVIWLACDSYGRLYHALKVKRKTEGEEMAGIVRLRSIEGAKEGTGK